MGQNTNQLSSIQVI